MKIVYTPVHGVGLKFAELLFKAYGFKMFLSVPEQSKPDPDFPTVKYPNPEEGPEVLDLSIKLANANNCTLIFATDPDADRLAICERIGSEWKMLNGNQIGSILGAHLYETYKSLDSKEKSKAAMLITTVSSKFLHKLAKKNNFLVEETLTGFKWLGNRALELMSKDPKYDVLFAYEEAIGFMVAGDIVPDKDGISALLVAYSLATKLYSEGRTLHDYLEQLYREYGYCCSLNSYFRITNPKLTPGIFDRIRTFTGEEQGYPNSIENYRIDRVRDLSTGYDSSTPDNSTKLPSSKSSQVITFWCTSIEDPDKEFTITFRTSGTEPKLKYYSEICGNYDKRNDLQQALKQFVETFTFKLLEPELNLLKPK
jgi:phosphomannomutase